MGIDTTFFKTPWVNGKLMKSGKYKISEQYQKNAILRELYRTVPRSVLIEVYYKYKLDYEMFGYDFNDVLKLAGHQSLSNMEKSKPPTFA